MRPAFTFYEQIISILTFTIVPLLDLFLWVSSLDSSVYYSPRCMPVDCGVQCMTRFSQKTPDIFIAVFSTSARPLLMLSMEANARPRKLYVGVL